MAGSLLVIWPINFVTIKYSVSLVNYDIKLSTEKDYFIHNFISIFDDVTELKTLMTPH
jgi:hypothetical protein